MSRRKALKLAGALALALVLAWLGSSLAAMWWITKRRRPPFPEPAPSLAAIEIESLRLPTSDGEELGAWLFAPKAAGPSVLFLHGQGGSRARSLARAEPLLRSGCSLLALTLRAHGDSSGERNDFGWSARFDVLAAVALLEGRRPGRPIVVDGTSLGAAAALYAAIELGERVAGYVIECPYLDLAHAASNRCALYLPTVLDRIACTGLTLVAPLFLHDPGQRSLARAIERVPADVPLLILAGARDRHATLAEARELAASAPSHARLVVFERAAHEGVLANDPDLYWREVLAFVRASSTRR